MGSRVVGGPVVTGAVVLEVASEGADVEGVVVVVVVSPHAAAANARATTHVLDRITARSHLG
ncbi:MAG: hypothetical protein HY826_00685 [Actinobacteria bacterium]|nr:hypothetical protein [Actinomycetota bacterium]